MSSSGQKNAKRLGKKHKQIINCIARIQRPHRSIDGTQFFGAKGEYICNTDHVPTYIEPVGNMTWALPTEKKTPVGTGGKDKDRFTTQLSILKSKTNNKLKR